MRDYRFSSVTAPPFFFLPCFSRYLLAVARSGSDIEMSKPLSQITRAEDVFSGRLTMWRSPLCRQSFGGGCQKISQLSGLLFQRCPLSENHMVISYQVLCIWYYVICVVIWIGGRILDMSHFLPGWCKEKCDYVGPQKTNNVCRLFLIGCFFFFVDIFAFIE